MGVRRDLEQRPSSIVDLRRHSPSACRPPRMGACPCIVPIPPSCCIVGAKHDCLLAPTVSDHAKWLSDSADVLDAPVQKVNDLSHAARLGTARGRSLRAERLGQVRVRGAPARHSLLAADREVAQQPGSRLSLSGRDPRRWDAAMDRAGIAVFDVRRRGPSNVPSPVSYAPSLLPLPPPRPPPCSDHKVLSGTNDSMGGPS